jgi:molybdopterin-guanine dinucleotide biosynthesis protein A
MTAITGVILAGGQGRRMTGDVSQQAVEKGLVHFLGQPMVAHVAHRLAPQVSQIFVNANHHISSYAALGYPVITDNIPDYAGPLAGLHAGLQAAHNPYVLTAPCDSPLLPFDLAERLLSALLANAADIAIAKTGTQVHPVFCLCKKNLLPHLESYLQADGRKFDAWYSSLKCVEVPFDDNANAFANINTPADLIALETAHDHR